MYEKVEIISFSNQKHLYLHISNDFYWQKDKFMINPNTHVVIMAGGIGSRFWPMSSPELPKQFVDILGTGHTFIQMTYKRFKNLVAPENVWVVTNSKYLGLVKEQLPELPETNILLEPCSRNTAPCIAYVSWRIKMQNAAANIVVTPSDHYISDVYEFERVIESSLKFTAETDAIVTLGIKPTRPETGYGYIKADMSNASLRNKEMYRVDSFKEKPDLDTAKDYLKTKTYFWNSGIFIWNVETIVSALRVYAPGVSQIFEGMQDIYGTEKEQETIDLMFPSAPSISIDYAVMEHADEIFMFPSDFGWSDVGTWGSLHTIANVDAYGNNAIGDNIQLVETKNCIVHTSQEKRVVIQGLDGYIVAEKDDTLLICKLSEEQRIKDFSTLS